MNIVTQFPVNINLNIANPQTEVARKEALSREAITQASENEQSAKESEVGSDRERAQARANQPTTYEFIKHERNQEPAIEQRHAKDPSDENSQDDNTEKKDSDNQQQAKQNQQSDSQQLSDSEQQKVDELEKRDQEVRTHEQAHANIGGQHAGSTQYEYERGPDGKNYAVSGEVGIDVAIVQNNPQATVQKMEQVQRAALAPAEPSAADRRVASEAAQKAQQARTDIQQEQIEGIQNTAKTTSTTATQAEVIASIFGVKDAIPNLEPQQSLKIDDNSVQPSTEDYDQNVSARALRIQKFYNTTSVPQSTHFTRYA